MRRHVPFASVFFKASARRVTRTLRLTPIYREVSDQMCPGEDLSAAYHFLRTMRADRIRPVDW